MARQPYTKRGDCSLGMRSPTAHRETTTPSRGSETIPSPRFPPDATITYENVIGLPEVPTVAILRPAVGWMFECVTLMGRGPLPRATITLGAKLFDGVVLARLSRRPAAGMEAYGAERPGGGACKLRAERDRAASGRRSPALTEPLAEKLTGAVLVADVSGFTPLDGIAGTTRAPRARRCSDGILNDYFGRAIDVITAHGGDVVRFAGDAFLAAWYDPSRKMLAELTRRAASLRAGTARARSTAIKPLKACRFR